jgi:hypothetical protein
MLEWEGDQLTWTNLKPRFQWQFTTQSDDKHIIDGLSNLAMKPNESMGELLARIINTMVIIKEIYAAYENKWMHLLTTAPISYTWRPLPPNGGMIPSTTRCSFSRCNFSGLQYQATSAKYNCTSLQA